ncbi:MAG: hypothetical protein FJZ47_11315 [Candidatus Tectomicrobia bacterium]|uniref:Uncharacterized protein n=1 Tax=Tectimicrobiota bacterium TaxID=2528274 RepID=A0A937W1B1_UNCTE|nr:hypothetical protein [Candidatus Tectomicrobia bacterium]
MPNPNPFQARQAVRQRAKPGNLDELLAMLWGALEEAEAVLARAATDDLRLKSIHAISQCAGQYAKLLEIGELEARLKALEARYVA